MPVSKQPSHPHPVRQLCRMALMTALITVCTYLSVPATIPFTMQTFAVAFALLLLGGRDGTLSILLYLVLGAVGVPVFSGFRGGFSVLFGVTGGYLLGFLVMGLVYWLGERSVGRKTVGRILLPVLGLALCYAFGTAWFALLYLRAGKTIGVGAILGMCVLPYLIPDALKLALAVFLAEKLRKRLR